MKLNTRNPRLAERVRLLLPVLVPLLMASSLPARAADSEAMQRERALNRILVADREAREREQAARGSGLAGIRSGAATPTPGPAKGKPVKHKPKSSARQPD
jgi:hypothetical protein